MKTKITYLISVVLFSVVVGSASATTYYVNQDGHTIDDFDDGNMDEYIQTVVWESYNFQYHTVFSNGTGALQVDLTSTPGAEAALCLRDDVNLDIGQILRVDITGWEYQAYFYLGIAVAATKHQPEGGPREDFLYIAIRNGRDYYLTSQFLGTTEEPYVEGSPGNMDALYIERIDIDTFETGYYIGGVKTSVHSMDVNNTDIGNAIGFYSIMLLSGTIGTFDNLEKVQSIQTAIDLASYGDTIYVAEGTYVIDTTIELKNGVALIGAGQETTIIDGNDSVRVLHSDNCDPNTILQGFTITNGFWGGGGGMCNEGGSPTITHCTFSNNLCGMGNLNSSPTITHCTFSYNFSGLGAGMYNSGGSPTITHCIFLGNFVEIGGDYCGGAGMYNHNSSPTITCCSFNGNGIYGAEYYSGGGGMYNWDSNPTITNCAFNGNEVDSYHHNEDCGGGGMYNYSSSPNIANCTFVFNNLGFEGYGECGGMYIESGSPTVTNCIFWDDDGPEIYDEGGSATVNYCDVDGGWGDPDDSNNTNIDADPCFMDPFNPDPNLRLKPDSPCINAGDPAGDYSGQVDIDGQPRVAYGRVDMGAYEFHVCGHISQNLMANPGFELGDATGWVTNWGFGLTADTNQAHDGNYSGLASNRTASWQGAWQSLLGLMDDGKTYRISGWVRLQNATSDNVILTVKQTDTAGDHYHRIDQATGTDDQWVHLDGTLALDVEGELTDLYVYFEGPEPNVNFYVDDAAVTEVKGDMNHNGSVDFIDFSIFALYYGLDCSTEDCDSANLSYCDNTINESDLLIFCNNWLAGTEP